MRFISYIHSSINAIIADRAYIITLSETGEYKGE